MKLAGPSLTARRDLSWLHTPWTSTGTLQVSPFWILKAAHPFPRIVPNSNLCFLMGWASPRDQ